MEVEVEHQVNDANVGMNLPETTPLLGLPGLTVRARHVLHGMNVDTVGEVRRIPDHELLARRCLGEATLVNVRRITGAYQPPTPKEQRIDQLIAALKRIADALEIEGAR